MEKAFFQTNKLVPFQIVHLENILVNKDYLPLLEENHLNNFSALMNYPDGEIIKRVLPERTTVSFNLKNNKQILRFYLKRYLPLPFKKRLKSITTLFSPYNALKEWENILLFHSLNLPTVIPVATGIRRKNIFGKESFLLTKGLVGAQRLDRVLTESFTPPLTQEMFLLKRVLIKELALLTRKLHNFGFVHRDFYLCHILVLKDDPHWKLFICDLHRLERRKEISKSLQIKELAALNYSAPPNLVTQKDRFFFLKFYLNRKKLGDRDRSLILKVLKKTQKIEKHNLKKQEKCFNN